LTSVRRMLVSGFVISALIGAVVLIVIVGLEYGFFSRTPPPLNATLTEIVEHVVIPLLVFVGAVHGGEHPCDQRSDTTAQDGGGSRQ
jgi:two-component system OmpR family sensor kinase